jgi:hypothetical protein
MCNCGRKTPTEVVTSVQAQADMDTRAAADAAQNAEQARQSILNASANANAGWRAVTPE